MHASSTVASAADTLGEAPEGRRAPTHRQRSILSVLILGAAIVWAAASQTTASAAGAAPTSVSLSSSDNPSLVAEQVTYTAIVTPAPDGGVVSFTADGTAIPGCQSAALNASGVATCAQGYASGGMHSILATYSGDSAYLGSGSATLVQQVEDGRVPLTVVLVSSAGSPSVVGQQVTYAAIVVAPGSTFNENAKPFPGGTVSFTDGSTPILGCQSLTTQEIGSPYPQATCTQTDTSAGTHSIVATYNGDSVYAVSSSTSLKRTVNPSVPPVVTATSLALIYSDGPPWTAVIEGPLARYSVYTATVAPTDNGGSLSFNVSGNVTAAFHLGGDGSLVSGCQSLPLNASGQATCILPNQGCQPRAIQAIYSGDNGYGGSASPAQEVLGTGGPFSGGCSNAVPAATSVSLTSSGSPSVAGDQVTYTATVIPLDPKVLLSSGPVNGTVLFTDQAGVIPGCGLVSLSASGTAACARMYTGAGSHSIVATYGGRFPYDASSASLMQTVTPKPGQSGSSGGGASGGGGGVGATLTQTASATVTVPAATPPTPSIRSTVSTANGSGSLTITSLKTVHLQAKHPALTLTVTLSRPGLLHVTLLDAKGKPLASWAERESEGKRTLTLVLPMKARHAGHDKLRITETGNATGETVGVTIARK
jgi:hypothetical protein